MENLLGLVLTALIFLKELPICYTLKTNIKIEYFQVLNKQPAIATCANKVFGKSEYIGSRLNKKTGLCEELPNAWRDSYTTVQGFSYAIKFSVKEVYDPVSYVSHEEVYRTWGIPVIFQEGSKIALTLGVTNFIILDYVFTDAKVNTVEDFHNHTIFQTDEFGGCIQNCKILFCAENDSNLTIEGNQKEFLDGKEYYVSNLKDIRYFTVFRNTTEFGDDVMPDPTPILGIEFSSKDDIYH